MHPNDAIDFNRKFLPALDVFAEQWLAGRETGRIKWHAANLLGLWYLIKKNLRADYYHCSPGYGCVTVDSLGRVYSCPEGESPASHHASGNNCLLGTLKTVTALKKHVTKTRCHSCESFPLCGGRCMWTDDPAFCRTSQHMIRLVQKHLARIDELYAEELDRPKHVLPGLGSEIMP